MAYRAEHTSNRSRERRKCQFHDSRDGAGLDGRALEIEGAEGPDLFGPDGNSYLEASLVSIPISNDSWYPTKPAIDLLMVGGEQLTKGGGQQFVHAHVDLNQSTEDQAVGAARQMLAAIREAQQSVPESNGKAQIDGLNSLTPPEATEES